MVPFVFTLATQLKLYSAALCHNGVINNVDRGRKTDIEEREGCREKEKETDWLAFYVCIMETFFKCASI